MYMMGKKSLKFKMSQYACMQFIRREEQYEKKVENPIRLSA